MKKRLIFAIVTAVIISIAALTTFVACQGDSMSWDLGNGLKAELTDNGNYGFQLTVSGNGPMPDCARKDVPWYGKMGRVQQVVIEEGVTHIGSYSFLGSAAKEILLPSSCTTVGIDAFSSGMNVYAYVPVDVGQADLYLFSETKPTSEGYWHFVGGKPTVWKSHYKVLFVGNSFTYRENIPELFKQVVESFGELTIEIEMFAESSYKLAEWADVNDANGKKLDYALKAANDFDIAVLQEQSTNPINNYAEFESGAKKLAQRIRNTQKNCRVVLYATWGYNKNDPKSQTIPTMEAQLRSAYVQAANEIRADVSHVGVAFTEIFTNHPEISLYNSDNHHQSYAGAMLAAYVHAASLLDIDVRNCSFNGSLDAATATLLKQAAYSVVTQS